MVGVTRHEVDQERIADALARTRVRANAHWLTISCHELSVEPIRAMAAVLLDHLGALSATGGALDGPEARELLRTASECATGVLHLGNFPRGDFSIPFPYLGRTLDSEEHRFGDVLDFGATAATWVEAFALAVVSGHVDEPRRMIGPLFKDDFAPSIHQGLPWSDLTSVSEPADLAEMDALGAYFALVKTARSPWMAPAPDPLQKPPAEERAAAARALDAAGELNPDQRLLRVLLTDDQPAFEQALAARLAEHRDSAPADAPPRSLLPLGTIALAALAVRAHGWQLGVSSDYLPAVLLRPSVPVEGVAH
ncbi:immunity 49 family protein [Streptomyces sp. Y1]|uniref:Immunity 49 family protein n=1 Tax=Streptomyces sp. Y1 TaxID=3238634 RepID=A0AB39TD68_9ACTN